MSRILHFNYNTLYKHPLNLLFSPKAMVQSDPSFPPEMSPTSPLLSPQNSTSQSPLLQQAAPLGYQSTEMKGWQQSSMSSNRLAGGVAVRCPKLRRDRIGGFTLTAFLCLLLRRSLFSPSGQSAGQSFGQQGVYNNMSITVSMAGGSGGVGPLPPMGQQVGMSNSNLSSVGSVCSEQQVGVVASRPCSSCQSTLIEHGPEKQPCPGVSSRV